MESEKLTQNYNTLLQNFKIQEKKLASKSSYFAWLRLCFFLIFGISIYLAFSFSYYWFIATPIGLGLFLFSLKLHLQNDFQRKILNKKIIILETEIIALNGEPGFWENGTSYHQADSYSADLDLFGDYSFYHFVNRTVLKDGEKKLANDFLYPDLNPEVILEKQNAIRELAEQNEFRLHWQALGLLLKENKNQLPEIDEENIASEFYKNSFIKSLLIFLPILPLSALIFYLVNGAYQPLLYAILLNLFVVGLFIKKTNLRQKKLEGTQSVLLTYSLMIEAYTKCNWLAKSNQEFKEKLKEANNSLLQLKNISEWYDRRMNVVVGVLFNSFFLYDLYCNIRFEKWTQTHQSKMKNWMITLSQIDANQSLGTYVFNHPQFVFPKLSNEDELVLEEVGHPLIEESKNVKNNFTIHFPEKIVLITGSNMSGKSTFLRSIGLATLMGNIGLPVNAKSMKFKPIAILTSLKQSDNLHENVSLFHAELLRLQMIRKHLEKKELTLVLIDEMLRGTNSEDKLYGSKQLLEELTHENLFGLVATHDLELGNLENKYPDKIRNACFESVIENNVLSFDYKLKKGIARNKNASFLMKQMEVIRESKINS